MRTAKRRRRFIDLLMGVQLLIVSGYGYAVAAYLMDDAVSFPEHAPPVWSWPAVIAVGIGYVPAVLCLLLAVPALSARSRLYPGQWRRLAAASAATGLMLLAMASPFGWELFDWYVS
ncbi:MAG TPA: hypothetical protein VFX61_06260 [Micromonosporaceae bacterium]|nr:hypothetical protein [Micromonosporaceae bacterium]